MVEKKNILFYPNNSLKVNRLCNMDHWTCMVAYMLIQFSMFIALFPSPYTNTTDTLSHAHTYTIHPIINGNRRVFVLWYIYYALFFIVPWLIQQQFRCVRVSMELEFHDLFSKHLGSIDHNYTIVQRIFNRFAFDLLTRYINNTFKEIQCGGSRRYLNKVKEFKNSIKECIYPSSSFF